MRWLVIVLLALAPGCSDRAASAGDGGSTPNKDVCQRAYERILVCVNKLDCPSITDAFKRSICTSLTQAFPPTYDQAMAQCRQSTPDECDCTGNTKAAATPLLTCPLDPEICTCRVDAGP